MNNKILKIINWFWTISIFYKKYKYISKDKLINLIDNNKYCVVEFVSSKNTNLNHFPNALQINKLKYKDAIKLINIKKIVVINNDWIGSRQYYNYLMDNNYKCLILIDSVHKNWFWQTKKATTHKKDT